LAPAVEVQGYAMAGKLGALGAAEELIGGADRPGIALADLPIPGFKYDPAGDPPGERRKNTIGDLLFNPDDYSDTDALDDTADRHEAAYFTAATKSIDSSVALLRLIEGRAALYQRLLTDAREVRQTVDGTRLSAARRLHVIGVQLAEARHDLATARALLAEEQARVAAINRRRAHTIERHAAALLFRRPRRTDRMQPVATARAVAALTPSAIVTCRREHHAPPEEVQDYVALMRELPAASFPAVSAGIAAIDRLDAARRALVSVKARAELPLVRNVVPVAAAQPRIAQAVSAALASQFSAVETHRSALRALDLSAIARIDLDAVRRGFAEAATLADVVDGAHARPDLARLAAAELEAIGQIAACLHAAFSEVAPVLRLAWAETLSEFDQTIPLAELSALPRWGEVPLDLRRELQELTNGLFARINRAFAPGFHAVSELVRICLLMSAQSPVDRIIPARLIAPAPVVVGSVLTLAADVRLVRVGMTAIVRREDGAPALRAAIDDIGDGIARARITERLDPGLTNLTAGLTVDLSHVWRA
jgi:hypothetical protein